MADQRVAVFGTTIRTTTTRPFVLVSRRRRGDGTEQVMIAGYAQTPDRALRRAQAGTGRGLSGDVVTTVAVRVADGAILS